MRWYGHVLRRNDGYVFEKSVGVSSEGQEEARTTKEDVWKTQVEKESKSVGLEKQDASNRARWRVGVGEIAVRVG